MVEIDDIGHKQDEILHDLSGYNMEWDKIYHAIDNEYHSAQYRDEKIKIAEKLNELIKEQNTFLHQMIPENPFSKKAKESFNTLEEELAQLYQE